ncbi:MAG: amidohydrolase family protein [Thermoleophilia bacterium]|nr:amidohydrolase family protein [Thermoleophilia bacterium]
MEEFALPPIRRISCEEGFSTSEVVEASSKLFNAVPSWASGPIAGAFMEDLLDIGDGRIARMDADGVGVQILALAGPGVQSFDPATALSLAQTVNDRLSDAVKAHPDRLVGLATMAPQAAEASARELERAVTRLGLKGAMISGHTHGVYLDDAGVWPLFEAAEALDAPVYIHPREPSPQLAAAGIPGFTVSWGYGVEAGTNALRLISAGVFDRFPGLRVVLGHLGETLPYLLGRMDNRYRWEASTFALPRLQRLPSEYARDNFVITSSGMNYRAPMRAALDALGLERVLFAADYPFEDQAQAVADMDGVMDDLALAVDERRAIYQSNAERVFGL